MDIPSEVQLLAVAKTELAQRLPDAWETDWVEARSSDRGFDAVVTLRAPNGDDATLFVEVKSKLDPSAVRVVAANLRQAAETSPGSRFLVVAPYLSERARVSLEREDVGFIDSTGNAYLRIDRPAVFIRSDGATADPWPDRRVLRSLKGPAAGRLVRALCDFRPPFSVSELAGRAGTSVPSASRVARLLEREALLRIERGRAAVIDEVDWAGALRRWSRDYSFFESNRVGQFLEARGFAALFDKLNVGSWEYAVTGSFAASRIAPITAPRLLMVFVRVPRDARGGLIQVGDELGLRYVDRGANIALAEPFDDVAFDRSNVEEGVRLVAPSQAVVDLMRSPGRGPQEAEQLLAWMRMHESAWRS